MPTANGMACSHSLLQANGCPMRCLYCPDRSGVRPDVGLLHCDWECMLPYSLTCRQQVIDAAQALTQIVWRSDYIHSCLLPLHGQSPPCTSAGQIVLLIVWVQPR